jgi:two-component system phosphate regulon sensor histidine kinase PhoR
MISRLFNYFVFLLIGFLAGYFLPHGLGSWQGACLGMVLVSIGLFTLDTLNAFRFLKWLKSTDVHKSYEQSGLWGEASHRVRRVFKQKDLELDASQESLRQFLSAIQASPNGVVLLDSDWHIVWSNRTAAVHLGIDPERDIKQLIAYLLRNPIFNSYIRSGMFDKEIVIDGRESRSDHPQKIAVHLFPYGDGRKLLLSRDITALEQAEVMRRDFVANVSHEIRTPLTVLTGFVETMQTLSLSASEIQKYLQLMSQQAFRMQSLVQDLLTLSHLDGSPLPSQSEWHDFIFLWNSCRDEANALLEYLFAKNGSIPFLNFEIPNELENYEISGSLDELKSAFSNLISNAIRYTPGGASVNVYWMKHDDSFEFKVVDTGMGIAPEHLARLTERFYRVDRSRSRDTGGTGLGLAIVKHVMQRHDGQLRIDSKLNVGSSFVLVFPSSRLRQKSIELIT